MPLFELDVEQWLEKRSSFEILIDARSPHEFLYSHIKDAINLYALNDAEHKEVGTIYKSDRSLAKSLGAKYICKNLQNIIDEVYKRAKVGSAIGIYCAKGGLRSNSIGYVLSMIGYRVFRLSGGYKAYRNHVLEFLNRPLSTKFITLFGNTGCYKSKLIRSLSPSIDLEAMANHLGSVFGAINGAQPSQKSFEDALFEKLITLKDKICFIEGESRRIGSLSLPKSLYDAMRSGINVEVSASLEKRISCIVDDYKSVDKAFFDECMKKISPFIDKKARDEAVTKFNENDIAKVAEILLTKYYDKVYKKNENINVFINSDNFDEAVKKLNNIKNEAKF